MSHLPRLSGRECRAIFERLGFVFARQKGSHMVLHRDDPFTILVIPDHKELDVGTLRGLIRRSGLSVEDFKRASEG